MPIAIGDVEPGPAPFAPDPKLPSRILSIAELLAGASGVPLREFDWCDKLEVPDDDVPVGHATLTTLRLSPAGFSGPALGYVDPADSKFDLDLQDVLEVAGTAFDGQPMWKYIDYCSHYSSFKALVQALVPSPYEDVVDALVTSGEDSSFLGIDFCDAYDAIGQPCWEHTWGLSFGLWTSVWTHLVARDSQILVFYFTGPALVHDALQYLRRRQADIEGGTCKPRAGDNIRERLARLGTNTDSDHRRFTYGGWESSKSSEPVQCRRIALDAIEFLPGTPGVAAARARNVPEFLSCECVNPHYELFRGQVCDDFDRDTLSHPGAIEISSSLCDSYARAACDWFWVGFTLWAAANTYEEELGFAKAARLKAHARRAVKCSASWVAAISTTLLHELLHDTDGCQEDRNSLFEDPHEATACEQASIASSWYASALRGDDLPNIVVATSSALNSIALLDISWRKASYGELACSSAFQSEVDWRGTCTTPTSAGYVVLHAGTSGCDALNYFLLYRQSRDAYEESFSETDGPWWDPTYSAAVRASLSCDFD